MVNQKNLEARISRNICSLHGLMRDMHTIAYVEDERLRIFEPVRGRIERICSTVTEQTKALEPMNRVRAVRTHIKVARIERILWFIHMGLPVPKSLWGGWWL